MMDIQFSKKLTRRLQAEKIAWLTTVRKDGTPQPTPVWFLWDGESFLIYSQPGARKVRNIRRNPRVAINLNTDASGGKVAVFWGTAEIREGAPPADQVEAYLEKYRQGIADIGMDPEGMARQYSLAIRVRPERVREEF